VDGKILKIPQLVGNSQSGMDCAHVLLVLGLGRIVLSFDFQV